MAINVIANLDTPERTANIQSMTAKAIHVKMERLALINSKDSLASADLDSLAFNVRLKSMNV